MAVEIKAVIFDLGAVLIDWNPRYLFRKVAPGQDERIETFLTQVCNQEWNEKQDGGRLFADAIREKREAHPEWSEWIDLYWSRWPETLGESFPEMVSALRALKHARVPVFALTNWSAETFPFGRAKFPFLNEFDGIVVSGEIQLKKPDARIFHYLFEKHLTPRGLSPHQAVFIDDVPHNVEAGRSLGLHAILHRTPSETLGELRRLGLPVGSSVLSAE